MMDELELSDAKNSPTQGQAVSADDALERSPTVNPLSLEKTLAAEEKSFVLYLMLPEGSSKPPVTAQPYLRKIDQVSMFHIVAVSACILV